MLQVSNIVVKLSNGKRLVDGVSFSVGRGEFVSILGSSGAGKSLIRGVGGVSGGTRAAGTGDAGGDTSYRSSNSGDTGDM